MGVGSKGAYSPWMANSCGPALHDAASLQFSVHPQFVGIAENAKNDSNDTRNAVDVEAMFEASVPEFTGSSEDLSVINADDCLT